MKRIVVCMLVGVLLAGSVIAVGKVKDTNENEYIQYEDSNEIQEREIIYNETQAQSEEIVWQEDQENETVSETDAEVQVSVETAVQTEVKIEQVTESEEIETAAMAQAKAKAEAEASAQMKAKEAKISDKTLTQEAAQSENAVVEIIEDI